ncbi:MAG TPA: GAF domain-containing protein, partial [Gaiellaceae bacterium]|nr:GAF domain-containing protein [Gaiellaceae bacterium]
MDETARDTEALLDALYSSAPVGLGFWDRDLRFVRVNEALARINERSAEDHIGRTLAEVAPQVADVLVPLARRVIETGEPVLGLEMTAGTPKDPDTARHWSASYYPVVGPDGQCIGVGAVVMETTERRRAEQRTELQHGVASALSEEEDVDTAIARVLETICSTLGWEVACFWSTDLDAPRLTATRAGVRAEGFLALTERASLSPALLPGRVAVLGRPEWLADLDEERFARAPVAAAEGLRSAVAVPVPVEGRVVGVIEAFSAARRREDPRLVASLEGVGGQLGQYLRRKRVEGERALLLQRERQARADAEAAAATLRKLERVADAALQHLSLQDLLDALLGRIVELLEADVAAILLLGEDGRLHVRATSGLDNAAGNLAVPLGHGLAGRVAASRRPLLVSDLAEVELASPVLRERGINSLVAIPLVVEDRAIGVAIAGSVAYAQFVEDDARLLELIADRIALAINQAALRDAERVAQERLQFLGEASVLLASSLDVEETLGRVARLAVPHFADGCAVDLVQPDGGEVRVAAAGSPPEGPGALLQVPLLVRGRTLGTLTFHARRRYGEADQAFVQELAARTAVAVDNARLFREAAERAQAARVLASVGDGVFLVDRAGYVRTWNHAAAAATGLETSEVVDRLAVEAIRGWAAIVGRVGVT